MKGLLFACLLAVLASVVLAQGPIGSPVAAFHPFERECPLSPATTEKIAQLRAGAGRMQILVKHEIEVATQRKAFIDEMTTYINERIAKLNRVTQELSEELQWIDVTNARIVAVAEEEKILRTRDQLACLEAAQATHTSATQAREKIIAELKNQLSTAEQSLAAATGAEAHPE